MRAYFSRGGVAYEAAGRVNATYEPDEVFEVRRVDGQPIPSSTMRPGMVQIGVPRELERAALRALRKVWTPSHLRRKESALYTTSAEGRSTSVPTQDDGLDGDGEVAP